MMHWRTGLALFVLLVMYVPVIDGVVSKFYDGNRTEPSPAFSYEVNKIVGIEIDTFLGLSNVKLCIKNMHSGGSHSCSKSCGTSPDTSKSCGCDVKCYFYNDCCPDYEIFCVDGWQPTQTAEGALTTTVGTKVTTEAPRWYIKKHKEYYDVMDMIRDNIAKAIGSRSINVDIIETCHTPSLTPDHSYYMVAACPESSTTEEHQLCSNDTLGGTDSVVPVYVKSDGLYYANKYCAACHGNLNESHLQYYNLSCKWSNCEFYQSPGLENAPTSLQACQNSSCYSLTWVFDPLPRMCKSNPNCPLVEDDSISKACNSYSAIEYSGLMKPKTYKNKHCALCNSVNDTWNQCESDDGNTREPPPWSQHGAVGGPVPLTVLFDFTSGTLQQSKSYGGPPPPLECPEYFIYSREMHECRRVGCPRGAFLQLTQCTYAKDPSAVKNRTLSSIIDPLYRRVVVELATNCRNITDEQTLEALLQIWRFYERVEYYAIEVYNDSGNSNDEFDLTWSGDDWMISKVSAPEEDCITNYTTRLKVTLEGTDSHKDIGTFINYMKSWIENRPSCTPMFFLDVVLVRAAVSNFPYIGGLCNESARVPKVYGERSFSRELNTGKNVIRMEFSGNKTDMFESAKVPQEVTFTGGQHYLNRYNRKLGNWSKLDRVYFCEGMPLCPLITLDKKDYRWQFDSNGNASLLLLRSQRIVPDNQIVLTADELVQICLFIDDTYNDEVFYSYSSGQTLATTIGCVVSLTLLALVIITYCSFSSLRNVPGKTVLSLSLSLFIAQLLLLTGAGQTSNSIVCLIIACFMHIFWLSVFTWTNILAFDLGRTFGKKSGRRGDDAGGSMFTKYSLYGWGVPIIVVGVTVVVHFYLAVDGMKRNIYGVTSACWLRSGLSILIAFGVPVAIALMINIIFFTQTVHGISSTMKMAKILKKDHEGDEDLEFLKKELYLYVRLSVTVGLTWISGFIIPYTGVAELGYLFIILNSLQGPVIFLSFTCSRRVMKLWSGKLGGSLYSTASTGSSSINSKTTNTQTARDA